MWLMILGLAVFFVPHLTRIAAPGLRDAGIALMGEGGWKGVYSLVSLAGLVLVVLGWMRFRATAPVMYDAPSWGRHLAALLVLVAFIFLVASYVPTTGRIKAMLRHPFLAAVVIWAVAHLLANGDLASLILFGAFLAYAIVDRIAVSIRNEPAPVYQSWRGDAGAVGIGVIAFAIFAFWLHVVLFGVSPF